MAKPPSGLTPYGRTIWNLDALLHDRFGNRPVYVNYNGSSQGGSFTTHFIDEAHSRYYLFTFATAKGSAFKIAVTSLPPKPVIRPSGGAFPLRIGRAYISCGDRRWLFENSGQGPANWYLFCHATT